MNCQSCGASLPVGAARCPWCNTPAIRPQQRVPRQFSLPSFSPQQLQSPQPQSIPQPQSFSSLQQIAPTHNGFFDNNDILEQTKRRRRIGPIIFLSLLTLIAIAIVLVGAYFIHKEMRTVNTTATTVAQQLDNPTGRTISLSAATILSHAQTANAIDNTLAPTQLASTFKTGQHIYVSFQIDSKGQDGTIQARWYANGQQVSISMFHHAHENMRGLVSYTYTVPAKAGVVALFWCVQKDCSDAQLAAVLHFTVLIDGTGPVINVQQHTIVVSNARILTINQHAVGALIYYALVAPAFSRRIGVGNQGVIN